MEPGEVRATIQSLAQSQAFYIRLLQYADSLDDPEAFYSELGEGCNDTVDLIIKMEE